MAHRAKNKLKVLTLLITQPLKFSYAPLSTMDSLHEDCTTDCCQTLLICRRPRGWCGLRKTRPPKPRKRLLVP